MVRKFEFKVINFEHVADRRPCPRFTRPLCKSFKTAQNSTTVGDIIGSIIHKEEKPQNPDKIVA